MKAISIRALRPGDEALLDDYLRPHTAEAYWLRSNVLQVGLAYSAKDFEAEYFGAFAGGSLLGVIAYTWHDMILLYADGSEVAADLVEALCPSIKGREGRVAGILGIPTLVQTVIASLQIPGELFRTDKHEGLFVLQKSSLRLPDLLCNADYRVRLAEEGDRSLLIPWRAAFSIEALNDKPGADTDRRAAKEIDRHIAERFLFVLEMGGIPVAFAGAGGAVTDTVIVNSVWTPPQYRGRGYAKATVAGALHSVMKERPDVTTAVLFASLPAAIRAYEAVGFGKIGDWQLALLKEHSSVANPNTSRAPSA